MAVGVPNLLSFATWLAMYVPRRDREEKGMYVMKAYHDSANQQEGLLGSDGDGLLLLIGELAEDHGSNGCVAQHRAKPASALLDSTLEELVGVLWVEGNLLGRAHSLVSAEQLKATK